MRKIFISHTPIDRGFVEKVIDILKVIGVKRESIFCSSFEGYGVAMSENFLERIKNEFNEDVLMIFMLSKEYYYSVKSICEMAATWVKTNHHIAILIPPFDYKDMNGVIPALNGMKIYETAKYEALKNIIEGFLHLIPIGFDEWERKRDGIMKEIDDIIVANSRIKNRTKKIRHIDDIEFDNDYYNNRDELIKQRSEKMWPNDIQKQLLYIKSQQKAVHDLINNIPGDILERKFKQIRNQGRLVCPNDFQKQLEYEIYEVNEIRKLSWK